MIRKLVSRLNQSLSGRVVSPRKNIEVPIKIWFEPDRATGRLRMPSESLVVVGETCDLSRSGIAFIVSSIRIEENYLVGGNRPLNAELDLPGGKVTMQIVGSRYEQVGKHISISKFLVGAKITRMSDENRENYELFLKNGRKPSKRGLMLGVDEA